MDVGIAGNYLGHVLLNLLTCCRHACPVFVHSKAYVPQHNEVVADLPLQRALVGIQKSKTWTATVLVSSSILAGLI